MNLQTTFTAQQSVYLRWLYKNMVYVLNSLRILKKKILD